MDSEQTERGALIRGTIVRFAAAFLALAAMFFLPAGSLAYWEAWAYLAVLFVPVLFVLRYLIRKDPELLVRRIQFREKEAEQKLIIKLSYLPFLLAFLLPGFDKRFGWSNAPAGAALAGDVLVLLGYGLVFLVFRENRYTSRIIEVAAGQSVVESGPYAVVRHPMYAGSLLLYVFSPLALGSYWAMIPAAFIIPIIVARLLNEEAVLARELPGYSDYLRKVHWRLLPGIW